MAALLLYGEPIDWWPMLGAGPIFAGNYWSVRHEARAIGSVSTPSVSGTAT